MTQSPDASSPKKLQRQSLPTLLRSECEPTLTIARFSNFFDVQLASLCKSGRSDIILRLHAAVCARSCASAGGYSGVKLWGTDNLLAPGSTFETSKTGFELSFVQLSLKFVTTSYHIIYSKPP